MRMPVLFIGHGNPMNAVEDNAFSRAWIAIGRELPRPEAVLCISAHWETDGPAVTAMPKPRTIHDFYGFPRFLHEQQYPAPGSPSLAERIRAMVHGADLRLDHEWGLDHGTWAVMRRLFPLADIPVVQLSLDRTRPPTDHYELGRALAPLRDRGILILGSGNIVHNLGMLAWENSAYDWAVEFDELIKGRILAGDHPAIINYPQWGDLARLAVPTNEHYLPLLYALALQEEGEPIQFAAEQVTLGSVSMRSLRIG